MQVLINTNLNICGQTAGQLVAANLLFDTSGTYDSITRQHSRIWPQDLHYASAFPPLHVSQTVGKSATAGRKFNHQTNHQLRQVYFSLSLPCTAAFLVRCHAFCLFPAYLPLCSLYPHSAPVLWVTSHSDGL